MHEPVVHGVLGYLIDVGKLLEAIVEALTGVLIDMGIGDAGSIGTIAQPGWQSDPNNKNRMYRDTAIDANLGHGNRFMPTRRVGMPDGLQLLAPLAPAEAPAKLSVRMTPFLWGPYGSCSGGYGISAHAVVEIWNEGEERLDVAAWADTNESYVLVLDDSAKQYGSWKVSRGNGRQVLVATCEISEGQTLPEHPYDCVAFFMTSAGLAQVRIPAPPALSPVDRAKYERVILQLEHICADRVTGLFMGQRVIPEIPRPDPTELNIRQWEIEVRGLAPGVRLSAYSGDGQVLVTDAAGTDGRATFTTFATPSIGDAPELALVLDSTTGTGEAIGERGASISTALLVECNRLWWAAPIRHVEAGRYRDREIAVIATETDVQVLALSDLAFQRWVLDSWQHHGIAGLALWQGKLLSWGQDGLTMRELGKGSTSLIQAPVEACAISTSGLIAHSAGNNIQVTPDFAVMPYLQRLVEPQTGFRADLVPGKWAHDGGPRYSPRPIDDVRHRILPAPVGQLTLETQEEVQTVRFAQRALRTTFGQRLLIVYDVLPAVML
jgi:hypothetical protein